MKKYINIVLNVIFDVCILILANFYCTHFGNLMHSFEYQSPEHQLSPAIFLISGLVLIRAIISLFIHLIIFIIKLVKERKP